MLWTLLNFLAAGFVRGISHGCLNFAIDNYTFQKGGGLRNSTTFTNLSRQQCLFKCGRLREACFGVTYDTGTGTCETFSYQNLCPMFREKTPGDPDTYVLQRTLGAPYFTWKTFNGGFYTRPYGTGASMSKAAATTTCRGYSECVDVVSVNDDLELLFLFYNEARPTRAQEWLGLRADATNPDGSVYSGSVPIGAGAGTCVHTGADRSAQLLVSDCSRPMSYICEQRSRGLNRLIGPADGCPQDRRRWVQISEYCLFFALRYDVDHQSARNIFCPSLAGAPAQWPTTASMAYPNQTGMDEIMAAMARTQSYSGKFMIALNDETQLGSWQTVDGGSYEVDWQQGVLADSTRRCAVLDAGSVVASRGSCADDRLPFFCYVASQFP